MALSRNNSVLSRASSSYYGAPMEACNLESSGSNGPLPVFRLSGRVALITGGGGAIGVETARRLLREGANVSLVDIDSAALQKAVKTLKQTLSTGQAVASRVKTIVADASVEGEVQRVVESTVHAFGKLDCAFLNAGLVWCEGSIFETSEEEYERVMRVNVKSGKHYIYHPHKPSILRTLTDMQRFWVSSTPHPLCDNSVTAVP
jgi:NAD(P)-dependent dehydrogenase (short-subunit alcohol dehydrogenase family)